MSLPAFQIVEDACHIAKCPGYRSQGGRALNLALQDLVLNRNLKVNLVSAVIPITAYINGPFDLPLTYLRTYDMWFLIDGQPSFLNPCSLRQMDETGQSNGYPYEWATDLSPVASGLPGQLYIYPTPSIALSLNHRYYLQQPDIVTPEISTLTPWFSDTDYLVMATAARLMRTTDDDRRITFMGECENMLKRHLLTEGDEQQVVKEIRLDPRRFRLGGYQRPTKANP